MRRLLRCAVVELRAAVNGFLMPESDLAGNNGATTGRRCGWTKSCFAGHASRSWLHGLACANRNGGRQSPHLLQPGRANAPAFSAIYLFPV